MEKNLSDADVDAVAARIVEMIGARLSAPKPQLEAPPAAPLPPPPPLLAPKLAYSLKELSEELGISKVTLYRLEIRGLLKPLPYFRNKIFSRQEVERFLSGRGGDPRPGDRSRGDRARV